MDTKNQDPRILALDLRAQRLGYGVLESTTRLLDWGACAYAPGGEAGAALAGRRVAALIRIFHPSVIVIKKEHHGHGKRTPDIAPILKSVQVEAKARAVPLYVMNTEEIREVFRPFHLRTKHEIASMLVGLFPELLWKLPPKRKAWDPERQIVAVFDAIALGFAFAECMGKGACP